MYQLSKLSIVTIIFLIAIFNIDCKPKAGNLHSRYFTLDRENPIPSCRADNPITWYGTNEKDAVIKESFSSGKQILCYVSKYDESFTNDVECLFLANPDWRKLLSKHFVFWEINYWEDPVMSLQITAEGASFSDYPCNFPPCILILKNLDPASGELNIVEFWDATDVYFFPRHWSTEYASTEYEKMIYSPDDDQTRSEISRICGESGKELKCSQMEINREGRDPYDKASSDLEDLEAIGTVEGLSTPVYVLWKCFQDLHEGSNNPKVEKEITGWKTLQGFTTANHIKFNTVLLQIPGLILGILPEESYCFHYPENILAEICAIAGNAEFPIEPESLFNELKDRVIAENGSLRGFPCFLDWKETFQSYYEFPESTENVDIENFTFKLLEGRRDLIWVNTRILSLWLNLLKSDPDLYQIKLSDGQTTEEFVGKLIQLMLKAIEAKIDFKNLEDVPVMDRACLLSLYNAAYQIYPELNLQNNMRAIAEGFRPEKFDEWFIDCASPLFTELALALVDYARLMNDPGFLESAKLINEKSLKYYWPGSGTEVAWGLYVHDIINSECINVAVIGSPSDTSALALLTAANSGWDPRKVVQILDPQRDADLIQKKGLTATDTPTVFVRIDDKIFGTTSDPSELTEMLKKVQAELVEEYRKTHMQEQDN